MIHVHGGSVLLNGIREAGIPGERLEWREVLCQGPTPGGLADDAWYALRAAFLAQQGPELDDIRRELEAQDDALLQAAATQDEIVLWFGPELFCQAILVRLLALFADHPPTKARLSLVSIDHYPGVDDHRSCTIGMLFGEQLVDVFQRRVPVSQAQLELGRRAWEAMGATTPEALAAFVRGDTSALPYLGAALTRLLAELPDESTGLSRTERLILDALGAGTKTGFELFVLANEPEPRRWLTDTILIDNLKRLAAGSNPFLEMGVNGGNALNVAVKRTDTAAKVISGAVDAIELREIDRWVGGTHLTPQNVWRWDAASGRVTQRPATI